MRCVLLVCAVAVPLFPAQAEKLLVDPAADLVTWSVNVGGEFPGAVGEASGVTDPERGPCLEGRFRFAGDSRYAGLHFHGLIREPRAIGFFIKLADRDGGMVRLRDAAGQEHLGTFSARPGEWTQVEIEVKPENFPSYWHGPNDGIFRLPLEAVLIAVWRGPDEATFRISNLYAVVDSLAAEDRFFLRFEPGVPCGLAFPGEKAGYQLRVTNRVTQRFEATVGVWSQAPGAAPRQVVSKKLRVDGWQSQVLPVPLPTDRPGYWCLRARATGADGSVLGTGTGGLAVVPRPRYYGRPAPDAYFGLQLIPDMEAAERLGAKAVRIAPGWLWAEPRQGEILWDSYYDPQVEAAAKHNMSLLFTLQAIAPPYAAWHVEGKPLLATLPDPEKLDLWREHCRRVAERYRGRVAAYEIQNEPDLTCSWQPGLPFAEGVDYYCKLLQAGYEGLKAGDPDCVVAGCDVSGGDFDGGLPFTRAVYEKAARYLDLYTGHPYSGLRYFGPDAVSWWPVENKLHQRCEAALRLLEEYDKPRRMWIGELGWGLLNTLDPLNSYSLDFAACAAQALVLAKSVAGVEKFIWFTLQGCNEGGYEYGLLRGEPSYPLPAAMAYATAAYLLEPTRPVGLAVSRGDLWRASFVCDERKELVVVFWSVGDDLRLTPPKAAPSGQWFDSFLRPLRPSDGIPVGRLPVYWVLPLSQTGEQPGFLRRIGARSAVPVAIAHVFLASVRSVVAQVNKKTGTSERITVEIPGLTFSFDMPPGSASIPLVLPLKSALRVGQPVKVPVAISAGGVRQSRTLETTLYPLPRPPAGFSADGDLSEWSDLPAYDLRDRSQVLPADPGVGWDGSEDLSLRAWLAADERGLYFAADVTDDIHAAPLAEPENFWQSDSVQLAIDLVNDSQTGFDDDDREVGFLLADDGPHSFITYPSPSRRADFPLAVRREGTHTFYEAFLSWVALAAPQVSMARPEATIAPGSVMAINFIANDNDGHGRAYWMGLTPGIGERKVPSAYREFVYLWPPQ